MAGSAPFPMLGSSSAVRSSSVARAEEGEAQEGPICPGDRHPGAQVRYMIWGVDGDSDILYIFQKKHLAIPGRFKSIFKDGVHPATIIIMCGEAACSCYKLV